MSLGRSIVTSIAAAASLTACITVNIYFPAPEVRRAAEDIVEETWGGGATARPTAEAGRSQDSSWLKHFAPARAYAQEADINVSTAAIRAIKESMKQRAAELKPYLDKGNLGIGDTGMLVIRSLDGVPLREQATIRRLVEAENRDRQSLYREIAKANNFGEDRVPDIQSIFAETWIDKAEKGWWVQKPGGEWKQR